MGHMVATRNDSPEVIELRKDVNQLMGALQQKRTYYVALWQRVIDVLFSLHRDIYFQNRNVIVNNSLYDGSGMAALRTFSSGLTGNMCPRDQAWFTLRYRDPQQNTDPAIQKFQKQIEDIVYSALDQSNAYQFFEEFVREGGWACTSAAFVEPDAVNKNVNFKMLGAGTYWIDENQHGEVDTLAREIQMEGRAILEQWEDSLSPDKAQEMKNNQYNLFKVLHVVRPRKDFDADDTSNKNFPFESTYWLGQGDYLLEESGYKIFPFLVWRVRRSLTSPWGEGPGFDVIRDQTILQRVAQDLLLFDQRLTDPAYEIPEELSPREGREEPYNKDPGANNYVPLTAIGKSRPINQLTQGPIGKDREEDLRKRVENHFFVPFFLMQNQVTHQITIPEYMGRAAEQGVVLAPMANRFSSEVLDHMMKLVVFHLDSFGLIPQPPVPVMKNSHTGSGKRPDKMGINYVGPLATLQKRSQTMAGITAFVQSFGMLKQVMPENGPQLDDTLDTDEIVDLMAEANGQQVVLTSEEDRKKARGMRAQAQAMLAQQQAKAQALQAVGAMKKQPSSPASNVPGLP